MSNFFNLERGSRQKDPLSPYVFIIGVELLSLNIKSNPQIKGVKFEYDQSRLKSGQRIKSEYLLFHTHTTFVFDVFIFKPETL
jgi:hypothetical protein